MIPSGKKLSILSERRSFTPRGLGTSLSSPKTFGTLEKPIPTISQLFPGKKKVGHDKKTLVMLFRAIRRLINDLRRPAFNVGLLFLNGGTILGAVLFVSLRTGSTNGARSDRLIHECEASRPEQITPKRKN